MPLLQLHLYMNILPEIRGPSRHQLAKVKGYEMPAVRGIRGATTADANDRQSILGAAQELFSDLIDQNEISESQVAAVFFTTTTDLNAEFPAQVVRLLGWTNSAMMCGHEMVVPDGLPMCLRILILVNTDKDQEEIQHVYLKGAIKLRSRGLDQ